MNPPVAPELFDVLSQYAKDIEQAKVKQTRYLASTSPALTFCENFYAQFFQNRLGKVIERFSLEQKKAAVRIRLEIKDKNGSQVIIRLITLYEKLCDIYPDVLALGYARASKATFLDFHNNYLLPLLDRVAAWAQAENYADIEQKAKLTSSELGKALESIAK
jgi:hypothetical protein